MANKVRVYAKAQNRTALGIMHAYMLMNPNSTMKDLEKAFPNELNPDSVGGTKTIFFPADMKVLDNGWTISFQNVEELLTVADGSKVSVVNTWTKPSYERLVEHAKKYDIEVADEAMCNDIKRGEFSVECINGYVPPSPKEAPSRKMWVKRSSEENVSIADVLLEIVNSVAEKKYSLRYTNSYIGMERDGQPFNFLWFVPQKKDLLLNIKVKQEVAFDKIGDSKFPGNWGYKDNLYSIHVSTEDTEKKGGFFKKLFGLAKSDIEALKPMLQAAEKQFGR